MRRLFATFALTVATLLAPMAAPTAALAAPVEAPGAAPAEAPAPDYLDSLLNEINARRAKLGAQPLMNAGPEANFALSQYLADLTPLMQARHACFHGTNNPVAPGWDYVK